MAAIGIDRKSLPAIAIQPQPASQPKPQPYRHILPEIFECYSCPLGNCPTVLFTFLYVLFLNSPITRNFIIFFLEIHYLLQLPKAFLCSICDIFSLIRKYITIYFHGIIITNHIAASLRLSKQLFNINVKLNLRGCQLISRLFIVPDLLFVQT